MKLRVLIAGGGIGGLTAACCLTKAGYDVEVLEQAPELSEIGAGIQLSANAMHVLNDLGLGPAMSELAVRPAAYVFRLHDMERRSAGLRWPTNITVFMDNQLHRADLHDLLARKLRELEGTVRLSSRVTGFDESVDGVNVRVADGSTCSGDLLVGADGVKSAVRAQLAGPDNAVYTGDAAWRLILATEILPKGFMGPVMSVWMGPGRHVVCYYLRGGHLLNFVGLVETDEVSEESWNSRFPWQNLKRVFEGWHPDIQTIIDKADRNQCFRWSLYYRPPIDNWSGQRVTMLGDAVHATLPYLAQGAAMAIEDGAILTRALQLESNISDGLQRYQRNRIERTSRIVKGSGANRALFHMHDQVKLRAAFANRDEGAARNSWLYSYNPLTVELR
jgi:salicylate hydroxylase